MIIIGAGLSGLIAANYLRRMEPSVLEAQGEIPNNQRALLRFRTDEVSRAVNIPFRPVTVRKEILYDGLVLDKPHVSLCNEYSFKVTGKITDRSIWDISPCERYIAPLDFINRLAKQCNIRCGVKVDKEMILKHHGPVISTMPMPVLMKMFSWPNIPKFEYKPIWAFNVHILDPECDIHQTIYYPDVTVPIYRASMTGNKLTIESIEEIKEWGDILSAVLETLGLPQNPLMSNPIVGKQQYGKIVPIEDKIRKEFIYWMTREHNVYSLGRFAIWKQILLDDIVQDIKVIEELIEMEESNRRYHQRLYTRQ